MADTIVLAKGGHPAPPADCDNPQRCLFEWYNWLTRQTHTDDCPPGVSPILHGFGMTLNDILPDDTRQQLTQFLPNGADRLAGTADDGKDETRGYLALDWLVRTYLPAWLDLAGITHEIAALAPVTDMETARAAGPVVREASWKATAARAAARDAAWAAAGAAARAKLAPTVAALQADAIRLYEAMIDA